MQESIELRVFLGRWYWKWQELKGLIFVALELAGAFLNSYR
jgi:hypothetical protein